MNYTPIMQITLYMMFCLALAGVSRLYYLKTKRRPATLVYLGKRRLFHINRRGLPLYAILVFAVLVGVYSALIAGQYPYTSDRGNYARRFENRWADPWTAGLNLVADFAHLFSDRAEWLFFLVSAICTVLLLIAYNSWENASPQTLLLLGWSNLLMISFYLLKQAPSVAFSAISLSALFSNKKVLSAVTLVMAILFHEAAYALVPLYLVILGSQKRWIRTIEYVFLLAFLFAFPQITALMTKVAGLLDIGLVEQTSGFLDEGGQVVINENLLTVLKGVPYYAITIYALINRKSISQRIEHYDRYLVICVFVSVVTIASAFMYWMYRFAIYGYFPMFVLWPQLVRATRSRRNRMLLNVLVYGSLSFFTFRSLFIVYFVSGGF